MGLPSIVKANYFKQCFRGIVTAISLYTKNFDITVQHRKHHAKRYPHTGNRYLRGHTQLALTRRHKQEIVVSKRA